MSWAFSIPLPPVQKNVLVALANRANEDGYCWPGIKEDLTVRTGLSRRSIQTAIKALVGKQLLIVSPQFTSDGRQRSNLYRLAIGANLPPDTCGEGAAATPPRVQELRREGAAVTPPRVQELRREGAGAAPESSSESSEESSKEVMGGIRKKRVPRPSITPELQQEFDRAWQLFPERNGKRLGKSEALRKFCKMSPDERSLLITAIQNFSGSELVRKGIGIKDFHRFLQNGSGDHPWREWLVPETATRREASTCTKRINRPGDFRLHQCGRPALPQSRPGDPRCVEHFIQNIDQVTCAPR